ncbi:5'-methylthioadenosine/adenosylhomocysteine nucleosidase [Cohnella abietis]|uniref:adenosylhomocysteine nucleosidase n=1 Tax=Cohnella abietis TaxID=2507935 RepID=A0A3T1CXQ9_9BACL|nr:5'-methylthioadenosine/adenosylhomocysteine nucleosidase [Cohnella abietis]BBI30613.1 5'-methylthioadenosine/S-adenosylhomocysteine nucleosidase [Cohnella abietis]
MSIAIIAAMEEEAAELKSQIDHIQTVTVAGGVFHSGQLRGKDIILLECGIGKVNAALTTAVLIDRYRPELIIHYGAAGGLDPALKIGDIVVATEVAYSDVDVTAFKYEYGQVPQRPARYSVEKKLIDVVQQSLAGKFFGGHIVYGLITTEDSFIYQPERSRRVRSLFPETKATDMEGASIAQTAHQFGVPFIVIRSLSDLAGNEAAGSFKSNVGLAARHAGNVAAEIVALYSTIEQSNEQVQLR